MGGNGSLGQGSVTVHHNHLPEKETEINNRMDSADNHLQSQINKMKQDHAAALAKVKADNATEVASLQKQINEKSNNGLQVLSNQTSCRSGEVKLLTGTRLENREVCMGGRGGCDVSRIETITVNTYGCIGMK